MVDKRVQYHCYMRVFNSHQHYKNKLELFKYTVNLPVDAYNIL